jgi:hypothetical protein
MRAMQVSGLVLIALGLWIIIRPPSYSRDETVLKFGDIEAKMQQQRTVPGWAGGIALGAGIVLVLVGFRGSNR